ncbi:MAG: TRAP transporter large permease [Lachnospiraceae bacterium]|nr:TRAP transporter large permease [Lachnospiraceae bacterium]
MKTAIAIALIVMLVLLFLKIPVYLAVIAGSAVYFFMNPGVNSMILGQRLISGIQAPSLLAIPFFVAAGTFMNHSGVSSRIMELCDLLTGRLWGGLAQVNVLLSTLMGGLSGSNLADASMEAKLLVPPMREKGMSNAFASVVTAASAMITPLIPPGIAMILFGSLANYSIGKLFVSGIGVGIMLCAGEMITVSIISHKRGYKPTRPKGQHLPKGEAGRIVRRSIAPMCLPIIIIGGIRIGVMTATEAGAVAVVYSIILGLIYKELTWKKFVQGMKETVLSTSSIMLIIGAASALSWVLSKEQVPQHLTAWMMGVTSNKYVFLLLVNIFLLICGMLMEGNAIMIILVPLLYPIALEYGIHPINFAMAFIFNMSIGALSPPMGTLMFVTCNVTGCPIKDFIKESIPFYAVLILELILLTYVPFLTTGLVSLIYGAA